MNTQSDIDSLFLRRKEEALENSFKNYCERKEAFGEEDKTGARCHSFIQEKYNPNDAKCQLSVDLMTAKLDEIFGLIEMSKTNAVKVAEIINELTMKHVRELNIINKKKKSTELERLIKKPKLDTNTEPLLCYYDNTIMINNHSILFNDCKFDSVVYILELIYDYLNKNTVETIYFYITNCNKIIITKNSKHYIFDVTQFGVHVAINYL
jgi:hypothetical protein